MREGFWYSEQEPWLPHPQTAHVENNGNWVGRKEFVEELKWFQRVLTPLQYRGFSQCRVCGCSNGSAEYKHAGWEWPSGFIHYVEEHGIRPSLAFQEFIMGDKMKWKIPTAQERIEDRSVKEILDLEDVEWKKRAILFSKNAEQP